MEGISFKERILRELVKNAQNYKTHYIDYEYLIICDTFEVRNYYIIDAKEEHYLHLTGVNTNLKPKVFFTKCYDNTIQLSDFDFIKKNQPEKVVKGTVRRKIIVISNMNHLFSSPFFYRRKFC